MSNDAVWYYAVNGQSFGPMTAREVAAAAARVAGLGTLVYGPGTANWTEARHVAAIAEAMRSGPASPPPAPSGRPAAAADVIDYEVFGDDTQYVEVTLDPGEMVIAEPGSMMFMTAGIKMESRFGDPSAQPGGFFDKLMTAGKRVLTGESLFMSTFTNVAQGREKIAFAAPYPGKIVPLHLDQLGGEMICQKDSFLCAARGVQVGIAFTKRFGAGLFGGEGFIMQRLTGNGVALCHSGGTVLSRSLAPGETLRLDTGCLVAMEPSVVYDIQFVGGFKNTLFGGEGLFFATLTGPGKIWLQSLPFSRLASRIVAASGFGGRKEEGSILGGLGNLLDGDGR